MMVNPIVWDEDLGERDQQLFLWGTGVLQSQGSLHLSGVVGCGVSIGRVDG